MSYDEDLAFRIRELLAGETGVTEQKMFGGLAFLIGGNMSIAASHVGGVLVRVDPNQAESILKSSKAYPAVMQGREMPGWLRVDAPNLRTKPQLSKWVGLGVGYAKSLPPKKKR